ncbi:hypothetical protein [Limnoglobus roseus]|uniref:WD40 repeat domain-containing protein n=1 Tax=Limnoglobus roseus TaxID=2598579 RepID=A0A5C1A7S9_9BACT|nr:hypothetical protein [Limnoglobus roseus]QEL14287.1 WD40 repeat domain-containing protein [Limnoglobus roseus]
MRAVTWMLLLTASATAAEPVEDWKSILDAPKDKADWTVTPKLNVTTPPHFFDGGIAFADHGGPFVVAGRNGGRTGGAKADEYRIVVDLRTGKTVGAVRDQFDTLGRGAPTALSNDGKLFAAAIGGRPGQKSGKVGLFDTAIGKLQGEMAVAGETDSLQFGGNRLLVATKTEVDVFDVATRKSIFNVEHKRSPWGAGRTVLTPTGKFLLDAPESGIRVYDVESTKLLFKMESPREEKDKNTNVEGMAVSPDGKKLAIMAEAWNKRRLTIYDTATGKILHDSPVTIKNVFNGNRVGWSADGKGILLNGEATADPETGKVVFEFPGNTHAVKLALTLGNGVVWENVNNERRLLVVGLDAEKTAAAKTAVASGGTAADAMLPPLTKATLDLSKATAPQLVGVTWHGQPDPAPPTNAGGRPIPLDFSQNNMRAYFVTAGPKPVTVFEFMPNGPDPAKTRQVKRADLLTGRTSATLELPPTLQIEDVTADGSVLMAYDYVTNRRLDFFPLDGGGKPYGFKPYEGQPEAERKLVLNRFLANDRIVTVSEKGVIAVWSLPDLRPQVVASLPGGKAWTLSPNKKYLAAIQNGAVRMIDLATGTIAGDLLPSFVAQQSPLNSFVMFRPDGREVLAGFQNAHGPVLTRWDTTTGRIRHEAPFAGNLGSTPKPGYLGDNYVGFDFGWVYDLERQAFVWNFVGGNYAWFRPDDRVWYAVGGPGQGSTLVAAKFPTDDIDLTIAEIADGPGSVLKPGTRVGLTLDVEGGMAQAYRPKIADAVRAGWKSRELELVTKDAEVEVGIRVTERDTGEKLNFRNFGGFGGDSVNVLELTTELTISANGEVLWSPDGAKHKTSSGFGVLRLPQGENDVGAYLHKQMWNGVVAWGQSNALPRFLAKTSAGVKALPQTSQMTAEGIVTSNAVPRRRK